MTKEQTLIIEKLKAFDHTNSLLCGFVWAVSKDPNGLVRNAMLELSQKTGMKFSEEYGKLHVWHFNPG